MSVLKSFALGALLLVAAPAWAGDLAVVSAGAPVVVLRGGAVVGTTPLTLVDLPAGPMELGFRDAPLSATAFTQVVTIPATGVVRLDVNLPARTAVSSVGVAVVQAVAPAEVAAPAAAPVAPPKAVVPTGDLYVSSTPLGAAIFVDGAPAGQVTPYLLRSVPAGEHLVEARKTCSRGSTTLTVAEQVIARADLDLVERPGAVSVSAAAPGTLVFLDGAPMGAPPVVMKTVVCGPHTLAIRAPGYLESTQAVDVAADETLNIAVAFGATPAPPLAVGAQGPVVNMFLRKEEFGTLVLDVTPLETALDVDGIAVGTGPRSIDRIAAGPHKVTGKLDGYSPLSVDIAVEPNAIARANLLLSPVPVAPPKPPRPPPTGGQKAGRIALNVGVSAVALGASGYGVTRFLAAGEAFHQYKTVTSDETAAEIYTTQVVPYRLQAYVGSGVGVLGIIAASGLWATTTF